MPNVYVCIDCLCLCLARGVELLIDGDGEAGGREAVEGRLEVADWTAGTRLGVEMLYSSL